MKIGALLSRLLLKDSANCYPIASNPDYHKHYPIGWNLYRCQTCAARVWPERWWHKLVRRLTRGRYDPFGRG